MTPLVNRLRVKLIDVTGETLVETLVSILISAVALMMLATAIGAAVNIIATSRDATEEIYAAESASVGAYVSTNEPDGAKLTSEVPLTYTVHDDLSVTEEVGVNVYGADSDMEGRDIGVNNRIFLYEWKAGE